MYSTNHVSISYYHVLGYLLVLDRYILSTSYLVLLKQKKKKNLRNYMHILLVWALVNILWIVFWILYQS